MSFTKEQFADLNFGYLKGEDLMQFCPYQQLISAHERNPSIVSGGVEIAYDEVRGELANQYDINKELSNKNTKYTNITGSIAIPIAAATFVSKIYIYGVSTSEIQIIPSITIGTTLNGNEIQPTQQIGIEGSVIAINRYFSSASTIYLTVANGSVNIELNSNENVASPPITKLSYLAQSTNYSIVIPANTYIYQFFATVLFGTPDITIGTSIGDDDLAILQPVTDSTITLTNQYFATETTIYVTIANGTINNVLNVGYNFTLPANSGWRMRSPLLVKILSIFAIRNILGSGVAENKLIQAHFEWVDNIIVKIKERQTTLPITIAPSPIRGRAEIVKSSFKTLG